MGRWYAAPCCLPRDRLRTNRTPASARTRVLQKAAHAVAARGRRGAAHPRATDADRGASRVLRAAPGCVVSKAPGSRPGARRGIAGLAIEPALGRPVAGRIPRRAVGPRVADDARDAERQACPRSVRALIGRVFRPATAAADERGRPRARGIAGRVPDRGVGFRIRAGFPGSIIDRAIQARVAEGGARDTEGRADPVAVHAIR
jgi:hypothetical protein